MKKLTAEDLFSLKHGDKVYRQIGDKVKGLHFVARMPHSERYLIFCDGEYLTHLYIQKDGTFSHTWYGGKYDAKFVGKLILEHINKQIKMVEYVYFDKD